MMTMRTLPMQLMQCVPGQKLAESIDSELENTEALMLSEIFYSLLENKA